MESELTGRELAVACARAMGWRVDEAGDIYDGNGIWRGPVEPKSCWECRQWVTGHPKLDDLLAWLHERGEHGAQVLVSSMNGECNCELVLADYSEEMGQKFYFGPSDATSTGSNLTEALQRLVVAVAQRGSGGRA